MTFAQALEVAEAWVDTMDGVESVAEGLCDGEPCITVFVSSRLPGQQLPGRLGVWKVVLEGGPASS